MRWWVFIFILPSLSFAADHEYKCQFDKPLPMLKTKGNRKTVNISSMKFVYSQNGFGSYILKTFFTSEAETFALDDRFRTEELIEKGFNVTVKREKVVDDCQQQAESYFSKILNAKKTIPPQSRRSPAVQQNLRRPAQAAVSAIQEANKNVQKSLPLGSDRSFSQLKDNAGKNCIGFRCNTNPEPRPLVQNNRLKKPVN